MRFDVSVIVNGAPALLHGLLNTVLFCTGGALLGLTVGVVAAIARVSGPAPMRWIIIGYVEVIRDTPFLIQAFLMFFGLAYFDMALSASTAGLLVLTLYAGANFSESIRAAIQSVPQGQTDAARALGLPYLVTMSKVVFPQAWSFLIPSLTNQFVGLIKESAALSVITVPEMAMAAQIIVGDTFSPVETYVTITILYWLLITGVISGFQRLERWHTGHRVASTPRARSRSIWSVMWRRA
jgi:His/Glu/Gln/Arg/opine family amino acid ABC transporter permease subunit